MEFLDSIARAYVARPPALLIPESLLWLLLAPLLVSLAGKPGREKLAWGAVGASIWAIVRLWEPVVAFPLALGGPAGWSFGLLSAVALGGSVVLSVRAARSAPEVPIKVRHGLYIAGFFAWLTFTGAVGSVIRFTLRAGAVN